jgi:hypothetical protein
MAIANDSLGATGIIRWHEVIELDPLMSQAARQEVEAYLSFIEDSQIGQREFTRARAAQANAPKDADTVVAGVGSPSEGLTIGTLLARRQEKPKIFIATLSEADRESYVFEEVVNLNQGGGYKGHSLIVLHLETLEKVRLPRVLATTGEKILLEGPMAEHLMHEINHAVVHQHQLWVTKSEVPTRGCFEESAIHAANALLDEKLPHIPRRFAYAAIELREAATLQQLKLDTDALPPMMRPRNAEDPLDPMYAKQQVIRSVFSDIKDAVTYDAGCRGIPEKEAVAKARAILMKAGVRSDIVEVMASDSPSPTSVPTHASGQPPLGRGN